MLTNNNDYRLLQELVNQGEGQRLEFKQKAKFPEKIVKEVVAFANSDGGYLLVGIKDDGSIEGLKYAEEEKYILDQAILNYCKPKIKFTSRQIAISSKRSVLKYYIYKSNKRPHFALPSLKVNHGKAFIRLEDKSMQASRELVEILKHQNNSKGQVFTFGEKEKVLLEYIKEHEKITLRTYTKVAHLSPRVASITLVKLVLAKVLNVTIREEEDYYSFNTEYSD